MKRFIVVFNVIMIIFIIAFTIWRHKEQKKFRQESGVVQEKTETVNITVEIPVGSWSIKDAPGAIATYGTSEDLPCYDPHSSECRVDRSAQVVGGRLIYTLTVPADTSLDIGYIYNGQANIEGIKVNGTLLNTYAIRSYSSNRGKYAAAEWIVACFIVNENGDINGDPECTAKARPLQIRTSGEQSEATELIPPKDPRGVWQAIIVPVPPSRTEADNISINGVSLTSFNQLGQIGQNQYGIACFRVTKKHYPILPPLEWFLSADFDPFALAFYGLGEEQVVVEGVDDANCINPTCVYSPEPGKYLDVKPSPAPHRK